MTDRQYRLDVTEERSFVAPSMHTFNIEMDDGTEIHGRFPNKEALRAAIALLMAQLLQDDDT